MEGEAKVAKLSLEDRCQHKAWKARASAYEDATKFFQDQTNKDSPEFNKFLGLVHHFVEDSCPAAQLKGLTAVSAYIENASVAGETCDDVMNGIVKKCFDSPKAKMKKPAFEIVMTYIEIGRHDSVQEKLVHGLKNRKPTVVATCLQALRDALRSFGPAVIHIESITESLANISKNKDQIVQEETKLLIVEMYKWLKDGLRPLLNSLQPAQIAELELQFQEVASDQPVPIRFLKSEPLVPPTKMEEPENGSSKLPAQFYDQCENEKWQVRKDALGDLQKWISTNPTLKFEEYADLILTLKKILSKDPNVLVVTLAARCLGALATSLKKKFQPYSKSCLITVLQKFKEKKQNVVLALRDAADAFYKTTSLEAIVHDITVALEDKNPEVKSETAAFLGRCLTQCTAVTLSDKILKSLCASLVKTLNDPDPTVRSNSAVCLGTATKVVSEQHIVHFLQELDSAKMAKVKEWAEKAVLVVETKAHDTQPTQLSETTKGPLSVSTDSRPTASLVEAISKHGAGEDLPNTNIVDKPATSAPTTMPKNSHTCRSKIRKATSLDERVGASLPKNNIVGKPATSVPKATGLPQISRHSKIRKSVSLDERAPLSERDSIAGLPKNNIGSKPAVLPKNIIGGKPATSVLNDMPKSFWSSRILESLNERAPLSERGPGADLPENNICSKPATNVLKDMPQNLYNVNGCESASSNERAQLSEHGPGLDLPKGIVGGKPVRSVPPAVVLPGNLVSIKSHEVSSNERAPLAECIPAKNFPKNNIGDIQHPEKKLAPSSTVEPSKEGKSSLNVTLGQLASQDIPTALKAFARIEEILRQEDAAESLLGAKIDKLILKCALQYRIAHHRHMTDENLCKAGVLNLYRCVTTTLITLFRHGSLPERASAFALRELMHQLGTAYWNSSLCKTQDKNLQVLKTVHILVKRVIQKSIPTEIMSALIQLLHGYVGNEGTCKEYTKLVLKWLGKMIAKKDEFIPDLNIDVILLDAHMFLETYSSAYFVDEPNCEAFRTIKTLIYHIVTIHSENIREYLARIPNGEESELVSYAHKVLNTRAQI